MHIKSFHTFIVYRDSDRCFRTNGFYGKSNYFTFIGDSRVRQLYLHLRELLETENLTETIGNVSLFIQKIHVETENTPLFEKNQLLISNSKMIFI